MLVEGRYTSGMYDRIDVCIFLILLAETNGQIDDIMESRISFWDNLMRKISWWVDALFYFECRTRNLFEIGIMRVQILYFGWSFDGQLMKLIRLESVFETEIMWVNFLYLYYNYFNKRTDISHEWISIHSTSKSGLKI